MAAGFSLAPENTEALHAFLCDRLPAPAGQARRPPLQVEACISTGGATLELAQNLAKLAPFGTANEEPVIVVPDVRVVKCDRLGNDGNTLRAFVQSEGGGSRLKTLLFRAGDGALGRALEARAGTRLHLAGHVRAESWNGTTSVGLICRTK
jgi:single-stranded-DNA-specific exonuclease